MATKPRKKWKVTYQGTDTVDLFPSEKKTYEWLRSLASAYHADPVSMDPHVKVWWDEGRGWQLFDDPNLTEWK